MNNELTAEQIEEIHVKILEVDADLKRFNQMADNFWGLKGE